MNKKIAAFDIDGTLIRWQLYHAIADALVSLGYFDSDSFKSVRGARTNWKQRTNDESFRAYELQLVKLFEQTISQLTTDQLDEAVDIVFAEYKDQAYTFTRDLVKELKSKNYLIVAISNSQTEIVQKIADYYGFDDCTGAIYHRNGNRFTGQKTLFLTDKDKVLKMLAEKYKVEWKDSVAVGDSSSDISMLKIVDRPIAFNPDKKLLDAAKKHGWEVVVERKNVIYQLRDHDGKYLLA